MTLISELVAAAALVDGSRTTLHDHPDAFAKTVRGASEATADGVLNGESRLLSIPITVVGMNRVLVQAYCEAVKNLGILNRVVGIRIRRGAQIADPLIAECRGLCVGATRTPQSLHVMALDDPGSGDHVYGLFGFNGNYVISYEDKAIVAMEVGPA